MTAPLSDSVDAVFTVAGVDRELEHLRVELADFPLRPRRLAILSSIDRWLDCRLALTMPGGNSAGEDRQAAVTEETR